MSVIGRLDGQVDEVLIAPVGRKKQQEASEQKEAQTPLPEMAEDESSRVNKSRVEHEELPVWLL